MWTERRFGPSCRSWFLLVAAVLAASPALAQVSGTLSLWSDQRYRGVSVSRGRSLAQLGLNYDTPGGYYLSALVAGTPTGSPDALAVLTAGRLWPLFGASSGYAWELGANHSHRWAHTGTARTEAEAYVGVIARGFSARLYYAPPLLGRSERSLYAELEGSYPLGSGTAWSLTPHVGRLYDGVAGARGVRTDARLGLHLHLSQGDVNLSVVQAWTSGVLSPAPASANGRQRHPAVVLGFVQAF